ncbi:MAG: hypothetical protein ABI137_04515 [Antricoccus sp.]
MSERILPFAYTLSSGSRTTLDRDLAGASFVARRLVQLLGRPDRSTVSLWRIPEGLVLFDIDRNAWPNVFLQAAGTSEAMTIEWRRLDDDGVLRIYTLGRGGPQSGQLEVTVAFAGGSTDIYPAEVFTADEAGDILVHYLQTESVPEMYTLREFDLKGRRA